MVRIAGEGNGDGITGAPVDFFHMMEVLGAGCEERNPTCKTRTFGQERGGRHAF